MADESADARSVAVTMRREPARRGPWAFERWTLTGVWPEGSPSGSGRRLLHDDGKAREYLWTGFRLRLHPDACESYWYNLTGTRPSLFVVCRPNGTQDFAPFLVTADDDEAGAMMEADDTVFSIPIPDVLVPWLQQWVTDHYKPRASRRGKRTKRASRHAANDD